MRKKKKRVEDRYLDEILEKVRILSSPFCCHFPVESEGKTGCGGCACQHISYEDQLSFKEYMVRDLLFKVMRSHGVTEEEFDSVFMGIEGSPDQFGYRNKMEFSFGDEYKGGPLALGLHRKHGHYDIVNVDGCMIADSDFTAIRKETLKYFGERVISYCHHLTHEGYLRHLLIRKGHFTGDILVDVVTTTQPIEDEQGLLRGFADTLCRLSEGGELDGKIAGILHTKNDSLADVVMDSGTDILYGKDWFYEKSLGLSFKITPFSFFQTNSAGAEKLYDIARSFVFEALDELKQRNGVTSKHVIYDLYSGTGTIAQILAAGLSEEYSNVSVIGVEIVEEAVRAARENAALNGLNNCEFISGDVLKVIDDIEEKPTFIVLDPPREGIHPKALGKIISYDLPYILYISCKPTSLATDLEAFLTAGYEVKRIKAVDMFPGTRHVETVVLLTRQNT